jgi:hypothetical protein
MDALHRRACSLGNPIKLPGRYALNGLFVVLLLSTGAARAQVFVTGVGTIGEYTTSGATVNASLVSGLSNPIGIAVSGPDLFVANSAAGAIGEYTTSGATVARSAVLATTSTKAPVLAADQLSDLILSPSPRCT